MKFINKRILLALLFITSTAVFAQPKKVKVDGVVGVVGDYVVLDSDIDLDYITLKAQGVDVKNITRCELFGKQLEDRLYAHHAIQDSLEVSSEEIYSTVDQIIDNFTQQLGSIEKVLEFYNKEDESSFRQEIFEINKIQKLSDNLNCQIITTEKDYLRLDKEKGEWSGVVDRTPKWYKPKIDIQVENTKYKSSKKANLQKSWIFD